jgi:hypothetical protein
MACVAKTAVPMKILFMSTYSEKSERILSVERQSRQRRDTVSGAAPSTYRA